MKICAIICEFNPFHNGHAYLLRQARAQSGCGATVCVMSGQFTERGEICRTDKFLRAKHAVTSGADAVLELPVHFAVAPAEIFAKGAVKTVAALNGEITLAFGCESGSAEDFIRAAQILCEEDEKFKSTLTEMLDRGESYIKSYSAAFARCGGKSGLLDSPNNVLGVEYAKAALRANVNFKLLPIKRVGAGHDSPELSGGYASAGTIRANADNPAIKNCMPEYSYRDFIGSKDVEERFKNFASDALFTCEKADLKRVYGCTEGLENRLKKLVESGETTGYGAIVEAACSKRYTKSRIMRILCANALKLYSDDAERYFNAPLPLKILAVKRSETDRLLPLFAASETDDATASECAAATTRAYALWRYLASPCGNGNPNEKMLLVDNSIKN